MARNMSDPVAAPNPPSTRETRILTVDPSKIGRISWRGSEETLRDPWHLDPRDDWVLELDENSPDAARLREAAAHLRTTDIPVAFPTETVYGLGADATRSSAVQGIYRAKQRPSDNPLIVHVCSLAQLRSLIHPSPAPHAQFNNKGASQNGDNDNNDPIPTIYHPLIRRFWPGPLTILLPLPSPSPLAPEVTSTLQTFGARLPSSLLALALIHAASKPLAAPSANASTKPSPTTAQHVLHDLNGRIEIILDGGPCSVGVESTVVDGLSNPPCVLRPGGISIDQLRSCPGWEKVVIGYKDAPQIGDKAPRAPGMKYKHYSPRAAVILFEGCSAGDSAGAGVSNGNKQRPGPYPLSPAFIRRYIGDKTHIGIITTKFWTPPFQPGAEMTKYPSLPPASTTSSSSPTSSSLPLLSETTPALLPHNVITQHLALCSSSPKGLGQDQDQDGEKMLQIRSIALGASTAEIARGLFSALRALDELRVDVILVEGISDDDEATAADDGDGGHESGSGSGSGSGRGSDSAKDSSRGGGGDIAAAVMNRLRKAAGEVVRLG
ncbi:MAG: hypothetical protein M1819_005019 [Sarea resinae]|nr:MAG: hypothetical protein M1819_005019 [Sarea resinae]